MPTPIKPTALLKMEKGKLYSDQRDRAELEPQPMRNLQPKCPRGFSKEERREWKFFAEILENYGLFTVANATHLELLARTVAQYRDCAARVSKSGIIVKGDKGQPMENPYWKVERKLTETVLRILSDLGLSSTGLARIGSLALKAKKTEGIEEFMD